MRPQFEGSLPDNIRAVITDLNGTISQLETILEFEHDALIIRQLMPAHRELVKARASLELGAIAAGQQESAA